MIVEWATLSRLITAVLMVRLNKMTSSFALTAIAPSAVDGFSLIMNTVASDFFLRLEITHRCMAAWYLI